MFDILNISVIRYFLLRLLITEIYLDVDIQVMEKKIMDKLLQIFNESLQIGYIEKTVLSKDKL